MNAHEGVVQQVASGGGLSLADFSAFFKAANGGREPFPWQERLLRQLTHEGYWPDVIAVPTGAGKSSVVDIHVFANALASGGGVRVPRRLVAVVGRRGLVDNQFAHAQKIRDLVECRDGILARVRDALNTFGAPKPLQVSQLRGGLVVTSDWLDDPRTCAVICATPDMFGSRLLFGGYGSTREARPREAGFLAYDCAVIVDEAHLNQQLLVTTRRVAELEAAHAEKLGVPILQTVETTATPTHLPESRTVIRIDASDRADLVLGPRLKTAKRVRYVPTEYWPGKAISKTYVSLLAERVGALHAEVDGPVGCLVNRVETALRVTQAIIDKGLTAVCWVGRMRPVDLREMLGEHPGLTNAFEKSTVDVVVATQTIEVGVDLNLAGLVTELASGSSLAQRVGRVNRLGLGHHSDCVLVEVVGPPLQVEPVDYLPYLAADLKEARDWILRRSSDVLGVSPESLDSDPPPGASRARAFFKRPERHDVLRWVLTSDEVFVEEELELWLRDDLQAEQAQAGIVRRGPLPERLEDTLALIDATRPADSETYPASLATARACTMRSLELGYLCILYRDRQVLPMVLQAAEGEYGVAAKELRPGDVVVLDSRAPVVREKVVVADEGRQTGDATYWGDPDERVRVIQSGGPDDDLLDMLPSLSPDEAAAVVSDRLHGAEVSLPEPDEWGRLPWLVVRPVVTYDEVDRQELTITAGGVRLSRHAKKVAERAGKMAAQLALPEHIVATTAAAGLHHDDGKADVRFQRRLGAAEQQPLLAKSPQRSSRLRRLDWLRSGLPVGWRHEHRSVLLAAAALADEVDRDLALRLIGTSHGKGRNLTVDTADRLVGAIDDESVRALAAELFDEGGWGDLMDRTHRVHGYWGCAFLEAVLRAADCQVSKEGS